MDKNAIIERCKAVTNDMRIDLIEMTHEVGSIGAHAGGSLSLVEIIALLYMGVMKYDKNDLNAEDRDRLVMSKGHGVMTVYSAMKQVGIITAEELKTFKTNHTRLYAHPSINPELGMEYTSGSLGQGISLAVGAAMALKRKGNDTSRVFVILGDGECDEGSVWEAAACASQFKLDNLVVVVDRNFLQSDGDTEAIMDKSRMRERWENFGFDSVEIDGHDLDLMYDALTKKVEGKPIAIVADTVKGKGVSFMENNPLWHNAAITEEQYQQALAELEGRA